MQTVILNYPDRMAEYSRKSDAYIRLDENLRVPDDGYRYVQIKHWWDLPGGLDNTNPYPEMIHDGRGLLLRDPNGRDYDYIPLRDEQMWFLWNFWNWASQYKLPTGKIEYFYKKPNNNRTFAYATPGTLMYVYVNMCEAHRCFTDSDSPEAGAKDVVTGRNLNAKNPMAWLAFPTGGALLRVKRIRGQYYVAEAIDMLKPMPSVEYVAKNPHLYFWCTQADKFNGATRFPQIKNANAVHGLPEAGIPSPLISLGGEIEILKSSCTEMKPNQAWSPYAPITRK